MSAIQMKSLTKHYGKARGIENVTLSVEEGEFFGFIGPNGAGKSTTIRTLLGLISSTSGEAEIFGKNIHRGRTKILADIGYLPSEAVFYQGMRVADILKLSADLYKKDCSEEADRLCRRLQLDVSRKVDDLSFGNRKKVAIVCALQHNPRLLILDEPTSGLDPLMQKEFFNILRERNNAGTTIFMSSHILSEIQRNCSRAAIIKDGKIIACDSVEELSKTSTKRVSVQGEVDLGMLSGVKDIHTSGMNTTNFLFSGDIHDLLTVLTCGNVRDLTIAEPDLEEIFLHYYEEEGGRKNDNH